MAVIGGGADNVPLPCVSIVLRHYPPFAAGPLRPSLPPALPSTMANCAATLWLF